MTPTAIERMFQVEATHWWYAGMREIQRAISATIDGSRAAPLILDAGCGAGFNLTELDARAVGVDVSEAALGFCRARGAKNLVCADIGDLPFPDATFDRVQSFDVLSDRGVSDDRRALGELFRVLRSEGILVLRVPAFELLRRSHDEAVETCRRYSRGQLARLLEAAGFRVERITYCNTILLPLVVLRTLGDRVLRQPHSDLTSLPRGIARAFQRCLSVEAAILRKRDLPLGSSLIAVARKPTD